MVQSGDDLSAVLLTALEEQGLTLQPDDTLVLAQKIVSKAEGCIRNLEDITPSAQAVELGQETAKDPRLVQAILDESTEVVRKRKGVLVVRHKNGWVMAQAGIDQSNVEGAHKGNILLLPKDPDGSATKLRTALEERTGVAPAIVIADSFGRPFRNGTTGIAIGAAGLESFTDIRGETDLFGRELKVSTVAHADEIASTASLLMGQGSEATPVVLIRGLARSPHLPAKALIRPIEDDLFR